jgi:hypothetical protein
LSGEAPQNSPWAACRFHAVQARVDELETVLEQRVSIVLDNARLQDPQILHLMPARCALRQVPFHPGTLDTL